MVVSGGVLDPFAWVVLVDDPDQVIESERLTISASLGRLAAAITESVADVTPERGMYPRERLGSPTESPRADGEPDV
jgi:hypothetical protein